MKVSLYSYFQWCEYKYLRFVTTDEFSVRVTKITSGIGVSWITAYLSVFDLFLTQWIMAILSMGCKTDNFESHKLALQIFEAFIQILLNVKLSLNQTLLLTFWLYVRQTWVIQLILAISLWQVIFLYPKGFKYSYAIYISITHLAIYVKETYPPILTYVYNLL